MKIEKAHEQDLAEILALQKLCYQENAERVNDYHIPPLTQTLKELKNEAKQSIILKVRQESQIAGSIRACEKNGSCYIGRVIVHPDFQNRGLGTQLMAAIEKEFSHVRRFELFTGSLDEKNLYFYQKLGYVPFKEEDLGEKVKLIFLEKQGQTL